MEKAAKKKGGKRPGAGRPEFEPTAAQKKAVSVAAGAGMSHEDIAIALEISRNTLEKHFEQELSIGAFKKRMEILEAMHKAGIKGNVAAMRAYLSMEPRNAVPPIPKEPAEEKPAAVGKKEQAQADAVGAAVGTEWETLLRRPEPGKPTMQ